MQNKNNFFVILPLFIALVLAAGAINAQSDKAGKNELRSQIQEKVGEIKQNAKQDWQNALKKAREQRIVDRQELLQKAKDAFQQKRDELKVKIQTIKNTVKQQILERVYDSINKLNKRLTAHYINLLNQIEVVLGKIENRAKIAEENGRDTTAVETAITAAKKAIADSRMTVDTQAQKVYELQITAENALKNNVGAVRKLLHTDLIKVRQTVVAARKAAQDAAVALGRIAKIDELKPVEEK